MEPIRDDEVAAVTPLSLDEQSRRGTISGPMTSSMLQSTSDEGYVSSTADQSDSGTPRTAELWVTLETLLLNYLHPIVEEGSISASEDDEKEPEGKDIVDEYANNRHLLAMLLFLDQITDKHTLLAKIEELIRDEETTENQKSALCDSVDIWSRCYPDDFLGDAEMAAGLARIRDLPRSTTLDSSAPGLKRDLSRRRSSLRPTLLKSQSLTVGYRSPSVSPRSPSKKKSRGSLIKSFWKKSSDRDYVIETVGLRFGLYYWQPTRFRTQWMPHEVRQKEEGSDLGGGKTIEWAKGFPDWHLINLSRETATMRGDLTKEPSRGQVWDETWPWLSMYFHCLFADDHHSVDRNARFVAESLTLLKYEVFIRIQRRELCGLGWKTEMGTPDRSPFVRRMIALFLAESQWCVMSFLSELTLTKRASKLAALLKIMDELISLGNYDSACAIRSGILKITRKKIPIHKLPESTKKLRDSALAFDDSRHSKPNKLTRMRLREGKSVIPVLGTTLNRLYMKEQRVKPKDKNGLINLRYLEIMQDICDDQLFPAQRMCVDESGYGRLSPRIDAKPLPFRTNLIYYTGITQDRKDVRLLLIRELKQWGCMDPSQIESLLDLNATAEVESGRFG